MLLCCRFNIKRHAVFDAYACAVEIHGKLCRMLVLYSYLGYGGFLCSFILLFLDPNNSRHSRY